MPLAKGRISMSRRNATPAPTAPGGVDFGLSESVVPIELWQRESTNHYAVSGTLTYDGQPVVGARIAANAYVLPEPTDEQGSYTVKGDKTVLDRAILTIRSLEGATIAGAPIDEATETALTGASATIETAFVMTLDEEPALTAGTPNQVVSGRLTFADGSTPAPSVKLWGYELSGIVVDDNDQPIGDVFVSIRDDEGETWSLSSRTGADGAYALRFYPLGGSRFTIRVAEGMTSYQSETDVGFEDESSAKLDIRLNRTAGTVTGTGSDGEFAPEIVPGAEYVGYMAGLANGAVPIDAAVTWPNADGRFTITIPALEGSDPLTFFQARFRFFSSTEMAPGTDIDPTVIPDELDPRIPSGLPPVLEIGS
jgi:hypothetical protein